MTPWRLIFFHGRTNVFMADSTLLQDEDKLLFHVKHNWFFRSGKEDATEVKPLNSNLQVIRFGEKKLLFLSGKAPEKISQGRFSIPTESGLYTGRICTGLR